MARRKKQTKKEIEEKQKKTIEVMKQNREADSIHLREILRDKLTWAMTEKQKALKAIENYKQQAYRLDGVIIFLKELLIDKEEGKE